MMSDGVLAGVNLALAASFLSLACFFGLVWHYRRREFEHLLFSLTSLALAGYTCALALIFLTITREDWARFASIALGFAAVSGIVSSATGLHFVLRLTQNRHELIVMRVLYGLTAIFLALLACGQWWTAPPALSRLRTLGGLELLAIEVHPTAGAKVFYALSLISILMMPALIGQRLLRGHRTLVAPFVAGLVLAATGASDVLQGVSEQSGLLMAPVGYLFFAMGVCLSVVQRFDRLSSTLRQSSLALREQSNDLQRAYEALEKAQDELVRKEQLIVVGELAAVIAHEVRNPLAIIGNAVTSLRKPELRPEDRSTLLQIIDEENSRLNRLVSDLLCYARPVTPQRHLVAVSEVVERAVSLSTSPHPKIRVRYDFDPEAPLAWLDTNLMRQVFDNVVGNAVQAMQGEGALVVRVRPDEREGVRGVRIDLQDTGEGMDSQVRSQAKTPFYTTRPSGTGLGLAIVDRIIDAHGGLLQLESVAGEGTTVMLFFPQGHESQPPPPRTNRTSSPSLIPPMPPPIRQA
jgi:signal transduction histidine kinase